MTPADLDALRKGLARHFDGSAFLPAYQIAGPYWTIRRNDAFKRADALIVGPLAALIAKADSADTLREQLAAAKESLSHLDATCRDNAAVASRLREQLVAAEAGNDRLRASLANGSGPCAYCNLPREDWPKCASGFPGCARADDAMLCPHVGAELETAERLAAAEAERDAARAKQDSALREAIRNWSARLHIPVTRMMSRALREEFAAALARSNATPTGKGEDSR